MILTLIAAAILLLLGIALLRWDIARRHHDDEAMRAHYEDLAEPSPLTPARDDPDGLVGYGLHHHRVRGASGGNAHDRRLKRRRSR